MRLEGKRVLVFGASKGIGRAVARSASQQGASIALAARSVDLLESVAGECTGPAIPLECDVRDETAVRRTVEIAREAFDGLDCVVYSTGITRLGKLADASMMDWSDVLQTNLVGAALTTRFAMAPLSESHGLMVYVSSWTTSLNPPWRGNGLYTTSKAALDHMARCWQVEHPDVDITVLAAGPTAGTELLREVPREIREEFIPEWLTNGAFTHALDPDDLAAVIVELIAGSARVESMTVTPTQRPVSEGTSRLS
jgi:NAD(P)-dependent dehydrogenase (short-subunit alcohol dehydrogenase family)